MIALAGRMSTVIVAVPLLPSLVAVIVAVPAEIAVTTPSDDTVATFPRSVDQLTTRPLRMLPASSFNCAVNLVVCPTTSVAVAGLIVTLTTGTCETVTVATALFPSDAAVMMTAPGANAVTTPLLFTLAIELLLLDQVMGRPVSTLPEPSTVSAPSWNV